MIGHIFVATLMAAVASAGNLVVQNNLGRTIYAQGCRNGATPDCGAVVTVVSGADYFSDRPAANDGVGVSLRAAFDQTTLQLGPYNLEVAIAGGTMSYDLSHEAGDPFLSYTREMAIPGTGCASVTCGPNDQSCEYTGSSGPLLSCATTADVWMYLS